MKRIISLVMLALFLFANITYIHAAEEDFQGFGDICYSDKLKIFAAGGAKGTIYTSKNTQSWVKRYAGGNSIGGNGVKGIIWSDAFEMFIALPANKTIITSSDGISWNVTDVSAFFETAITSVSEKDGHIFVTDSSSNIFYTDSTSFDTWIRIEQDVKTSKTWRGSAPFPGGVMFYSTAAWDGAVHCLLVDTDTMGAQEITFDKENYNRIYDMIYSEELDTLFAVYCITGNNYESSYLAYFDETSKSFITVDTVLTSGISICETENYLLIPTINKAKIYQIEKTKAFDFRPADVKEQEISGITTSHRIYNITYGNGKAVAVTSAKAVVVMEEPLLSSNVLLQCQTAAEISGLDITADSYEVYSNGVDTQYVPLTAFYADQSGIKMTAADAGTVWEIAGVSDAGLAGDFSISTDGVLSIPPVDTSAGVTVEISAENSGYLGSTSILVRRAPEPVKAVIEGPAEVLIPKSTASAAYQYHIYLKDQYGKNIDNADSSVSVTAAKGISFDNNTSCLTVTSEAEEGSIELTATVVYDGLENPFHATYAVRLKEEIVPTAIQVSGSPLVFVSEKEEVTELYGYTVVDQHGRPIEGAAATGTILGTLPEGVTFLENRLSVPAQTEDCTITLQIVYGGLIKDFEIKIKTIAIEILGNSSVTVSVNEEKSGAYTAAVTDRDGNAVDATISWSIASGDGINIDADNGTLYITKLAGSQTAVIRAGINDLIYGEKSITVKRESSNGSGSGGSSGGSSGGGKTNISVSGVTLPAPEPINEEPSRNTFLDLAGYEWAKEAIETLFGKGYLSGVSSTSFEPGRNITRAEFIKLVSQIFEMEQNPQPSTAKVFTDVKESDWYYPYVCTAAEAGMISGDESGRFRPDDFITRQDMSKIIYRLMEAQGGIHSGEAPEFSDEAEISEYAKEAVHVLAGEGILTGMPDGSFSPGSFAKRAEAAVVIHRVLNKI